MDEGERGVRRARREREGFVEGEVLVPRDLEFKMKPQWGGDQDMLELGRGNACIVDSAAAFDDSSKFDDDGKLRRTGMKLSAFRRLHGFIYGDRAF